MNILFQCSEYPPFRNGGIGTVTKIVAEELVKNGHNVYVAGYYTNLQCREAYEDIGGVGVYRYNLGTRRNGTIQKLFTFLNWFHLAGVFIQRELSWYENRIEALIKKHDIDILEMTDFYHFCLFRAMLTFKTFNVPTVMRVHGSASFIQLFSGKDQPWVKDNDKRHFLRMDYICSVSRFAENYVSESFPDVSFKKAQVIYNPIEDGFFKHNEPSNNHRVLFVGKLIKTKGAYSVVEAFCRLAKDFPGWELRLVGKGDEETLMAFVPSELCDRVKVLGFCNRETVAKEIDGCSFACIPSYFENFSMVPLEIMGRTRTMIFTNRTSGSEVIEDGVDGFTVDPEDIEMICDRMKRLMGNVQLRNSFAELSYEKVSSHFSAKHVVSELLDFYSSCISVDRKN